MIKPYIVERNVIRIIGKRVIMGGSKPEIGEISSLFKELDVTLNSIPNRVDNRFFGISIDFWHMKKNENGQEGLHSYMLGAEVTSLIELPFDMESRIIPASRWVYLSFRYNDPDVRALAPPEHHDDYGYLTGCVFSWGNRWINENGYQRQDFPEEMEIYGLTDGFEDMDGPHLTLAIPVI